MNKILILTVIFAIGAIMLTSSTAPAIADKDDNPGKAKGCEKASDNSKAREKNPHCNTTGADLEITGPEEHFTSTGRGTSFTVTVTNNGPEAAENVVVDATFVCNSTVLCDVFTIAVAAPSGDDGIINAGESVIYKITLRGIIGTMDIISSATSDTEDPNAGNNSLTTTITRP